MEFFEQIINHFITACLLGFVCFSPPIHRLYLAIVLNYAYFSSSVIRIGGGHTNLEEKWLIRAYINNPLALTYCDVAVRDLAILEIIAYEKKI